MAVIAIASAKGSPGVTTSALAFTLSWSSRMLLAECDPAGGSALAGFLQGQLPADRGLLPLAIAELRENGLAAAFRAQLVDLEPPHGRRLLLPGLTDPVQAGTLAPLWSRLALFFTELEYADPPGDVIVDCGRLAAEHVPWPLLDAADAVLLAVRPTLASVAPAVPVASALTRRLQEALGSSSSLGLLVIGEGPYGTREIAAGLVLPVVASVPEDRRAASVLTNGGVVKSRSRFMRAAAGAEASVRQFIGRHRQIVPRRPVLKEISGGTI
ncbi:hypothetical protein GCM10009557_02980 [Virgisporangium ochraceum]|uniref:Uncharacterized protein n=1 Tax=Virgisporangium ochraceum TaxID=65505 RepID=A0A8J4EAR6_9ACTN|nr:ParA family protein [Virgisporangium ochraceum]GIJ67961.1 hypothetical protein Voc01_028780 [Virgisporangium ochraceum]